MESARIQITHGSPCQIATGKILNAQKSIGKVASWANVGIAGEELSVRCGKVQAYYDTAGQATLDVLTILQVCSRPLKAGETLPSLISRACKHVKTALPGGLEAICLKHVPGLVLPKAPAAPVFAPYVPTVPIAAPTPTEALDITLALQD